MGDVYNWSTVLRTEYNVINDNCGAHRVNSLRVDVIVPLRGTCGEMGGLLYPTAALLRSLQWVSDSRSRVAEPMGDMGGWLIPTAALLRSLQWVSDSRSRYAEPMGEMGGWLIPTAALLRSLQWVSDSRSRYAEHRGRWEVCLYPQRRCYAACSGFRMVGPATRNLWGAMGDGCVMREMRSVLEGHVYVKPTASCGAAQLWAYAYTSTLCSPKGD